MSKCKAAYKQFSKGADYWDTKPERIWQAAWNAATQNAAEIVRDHSFKIQSGSPHRQVFDAAKDAIEQEQCK